MKPGLIADEHMEGLRVARGNATAGGNPPGFDLAGITVLREGDFGEVSPVRGEMAAEGRRGLSGPRQRHEGYAAFCVMPQDAAVERAGDELPKAF